MARLSRTAANSAALCLAGVLLSTSIGPALIAQHHGVPAEQPAGSSTDPFASFLADAVLKMHEKMMAPKPTGDADRDFLATMIPHHEGAIEMARLVLIHGKDPLVRRLAEEIIAGQQSEIAAMRARLQILEKGADPQPGGYPALGGTRGISE
jgi:hypothetical protein